MYNQENEFPDFGRGFYTVIRKRIDDMIYVSSINARNNVCTYCFQYEKAKEDGLNILEFNDHNKEWLDFVTKNKFSKYEHGYDIVIGPSTNHHGLMYCNRYDMGHISAEEAIKECRSEVFQISFHSDLSKKYLTDMTEIIHKRYIQKCKKEFSSFYCIQMYHADILFGEYMIDEFIEMNYGRYEGDYIYLLMESIGKYIESQDDPSCDPFY